MLKCPNNNCCTEFSDADIKLHWRTFQEGTCYKCGGQYDWGLDIEKYKPAPVAAPVKQAPAKKAPAKRKHQLKRRQQQRNLRNR